MSRQESDLVFLFIKLPVNYFSRHSYNASGYIDDLKDLGQASFALSGKLLATGCEGLDLHTLSKAYVNGIIDWALSNPPSSNFNNTSERR